MLEWKAIWEQQHHRPFGVSCAVFYSSTLTRFLGSVLPRGCRGFAASRLSCRWWCFWVPCRSAGKANTTTPWEAVKPEVGTTAKRVLFHSAQLYKTQFKLRKWVVSYTPLETFWRRRHSFLKAFISDRVMQGRAISSMCIAVSHFLIATLDTVLLLEPHFLGHRSIWECPFSKQKEEKLLPITN